MFNLQLNFAAFSNSSKMDVKDIKLYLSDTMNILPSNIIQTMLTLLPMRDAFRTSILSRNWRHHCANIPKLQFDDELFEGSAYNKLPIKCKLTHVIYPILLLHRGPILDFSLCFSELSSCYQIDQIILYLLKSSTVKKFMLCIGVGDNHKLPPSFFMMQQLTCLTLQNCAFQPPSTFCGFSRLTSLYFHNVSIVCKVLLRFIVNCPLLKSFTLVNSNNSSCIDKKIDLYAPYMLETTIRTQLFVGRVG